jgi:hypothetical protein
VCYDVWRVKQINFYYYFFYEIRWIGRVKRGLWYYIRDDTIRALLYPRESCVNASVVLVQPVVVVVVILVSVADTCIVVCIFVL